MYRARAIVAAQRQFNVQNGTYVALQHARLQIRNVYAVRVSEMWPARGVCVSQLHARAGHRGVCSNARLPSRSRTLRN
eukprot:11195240-Lingulodinium_polyedra.AAC.1